MVERHQRVGEVRILTRMEPQRRGVFEGTTSVNHTHVSPLGELSQTARQRLHELVLALPQSRDVDIRSRERNPPAGRKFLGLRNHPRYVQQCFGGNTAAQQAGPAKPGFRLDERHFQAPVRGKKRSGIATWTAAQDNKLRMHSVANS